MNILPYEVECSLETHTFCLTHTHSFTQRKRGGRRDSEGNNGIKVQEERLLNLMTQI